MSRINALRLRFILATWLLAFTGLQRRVRRVPRAQAAATKLGGPTRRPVSLDHPAIAHKRPAITTSSDGCHIHAPQRSALIQRSWNPHPKSTVPIAPVAPHDGPMRSGPPWGGRPQPRLRPGFCLSDTQRYNAVQLPTPAPASPLVNDSSLTETVNGIRNRSIPPLKEQSCLCSAVLEPSSLGLFG